MSLSLSQIPVAGLIMTPLPPPRFLSPHPLSSAARLNSLPVELPGATAPVVIGSGAMAMVNRWEDRIAHYLLQRAYDGLNAAESAEEASKLRVEYRSPHSIHFKLPSCIASYFPVLLSFLPSQRRSGFMEISATCALIAQRWINDFECGIKIHQGTANDTYTSSLPASASILMATSTSGSASILPAAMNDPMMLYTIVTTLSIHLLRQGTCLSRRMERDAGDTRRIHAAHVVYAICCDRELAAFCFQLVPISLDFTAFVEAARAMDDRRMMMAVTGSAGGDIGDGMVPTAEDIKDFTTPIAYDRALQFVFEQSFRHLSQLNQSSWYMNEAKVKHYARSFARGEMADEGMGRWLRECGIRPLQFYGCLPRAVAPSLPFARQTVASSPSTACFTFIRSNPGGSNAVIKMYDGSSGRMIKLTKPTETSASVTDEEGSETARILTQFSRFGPTFYVNNHPPSARRLFIATLIDESSHMNGLPTLPTDVINIIAHFTDIDLPYIESEAKQQMAEWTAARPHRSPSYPGQVLNPVECPIQFRDRGGSP